MERLISRHRSSSLSRLRLPSSLDSIDQLPPPFIPKRGVFFCGRRIFEIYHLLSGYECPWNMTRALELALYRTHCVPSISAPLDRGVLQADAGALRRRGTDRCRDRQAGLRERTRPQGAASTDQLGFHELGNTQDQRRLHARAGGSSTARVPMETSSEKKNPVILENKSSIHRSGR
jgi:hypothetical protein